MSLSPDELEKVIKRCKKGDRKGQHILFETYYSSMMSVCMRYSNDKDTAQDVCQTGFIKIFEKLDLYTSGGSFEGWMRRIMVNCAIDKIRKSKKELSIIEDEGRIPDVESEDADLDLSTVNYQVILDAVQQLSPAYRTVFNLFVMENTPHKEIAEILNISEGTSKSNLAKAKKRLKVLLKDKIQYHE